jgi:1,4-dihydroxy-2-naphthoyl-CoA hydrolase
MADVASPEKMNGWNAGGLPHMLGIKVTETAEGRVVGRLPVKKELIAGNGALWAPAIVALADTLCAYGVSTKWPDGANGFTTVELKCNFMGTLNAGTVKGVAELVHGGRTTQVWDATLTNEETGKLLAVFRCTQIILYPRAGQGQG